MHQQTGSVYLDAPRRPNRQQQAAAKAKRRRRAALANVLLAIGLLALTASGLIAGVRILVLDTGPVMDAFETTLDDPLARAELEREVAAGIEEGLVGAELAAVASAFDLDVAEEANRIAGVVLDDETVREELRLLVADAHRRMVIETTDVPLDLAPITAAVLAVIERESPRLALVIPTDSTLWTVDAATFPDFTAAADLLNRAQLYSLIPALLIFVAAGIHPRRHRVAAWIGRWMLTVGLASGLAAIAIPYVAGNISGYSVAEIAARAITIKLLAPAVIAGIIGVGLVTFAAVMKHREQRQIADVGAHAALGGFDEPPLLKPTSAPTIDLASRGLVDVNHPLTNI